MSTLLLHKGLGTDGYHGKVLVQIANGSVQIANKSVQIANRSVQIAITTHISAKIDKCKHFFKLTCFQVLGSQGPPKSVDSTHRASLVWLPRSP
jgi:hypothetical protein